MGPLDTPNLGLPDTSHRICGRLLQQFVKNFLPYFKPKKTNTLFFHPQESNSTYYSFVLGASAPDAIKHLTSKFHTFRFATFQYQFALTQSQSQTFSPLAFSLGYGAHLAQDFVGHYPTGYLTPEYDHPIEIAADTYNYFAHFKPLGYNSFPFQKFNAEAVDFVLRANEFYSRQNGTDFPVPFNRSTIQKSISDFESLISIEAAAVRFNIFYKEESMDHFVTLLTQLL